MWIVRILTLSHAEAYLSNITFSADLVSLSSSFCCEIRLKWVHAHAFDITPPKILRLCHSFFDNFAHYGDSVSGQFSFILGASLRKVVESTLKQLNVFLSS